MAFSVQRFGFPDDDHLEPPSVQDNRIARQTRTVAFLLSALVVSNVANLALLPEAFRQADVVPYVADGGVFGCQVKIVPGPIQDGPKL